MHVQVQINDGVAIVTLHDPDTRNAITLRLVDELETALTGLASHPQVKALVITGAGTAFCSGADRKVLQDADEKSLRVIYQAFIAVRNFPLPTVAAVNGPAVGAGLNLALACDIRVAAESAVFDSRFVNIPIPPGGGHAWMLHHSTQAQTAAAMSLFGVPVDGRRAADIGLAWRCVPAHLLMSTVAEICADVRRAPRELLVKVKASIRSTSLVPTHAEAVEAELDCQVRHLLEAGPLSGDNGRSSN